MADTAQIEADPRPVVTTHVLDMLGRSRSEPEFLRSLRLRARHSYQAQALPRRSEHLWKYSDPARLWPRGEPVSLGPVHPLPLPALDGRGAMTVVQPGTQLRATVDARVAEQGVRIVCLGEDGPQLHLLGQAVPAEHGLFEALNLATFSAGAMIYIPRGVRVTLPLHVVIAATQAHSAARLLVVIEEGAEATIVEEHLGGDLEARASTVSELFVAPGATLQHVLIQDWPVTVSGHQTVRACVERDGHFASLLLNLGGRDSKLDLGARLEGSGASSEMVGVVLGDDRQRLDLHTVQDHAAAHGTSSIDVKVVLGQRAEAAYTGLIRVAKDAPGCKAYQENRNLLLSSRARAQTIPELEILTDDVSCSHGATVSPVDPAQLFYLQSRGLPAPQALRLVVQSFFENTLARLPEALRVDVEQRLAPRLDSMSGVVA
ncbi:MAG: Fe-S cluster assembly protein SufD [Pseudomonadota bacterium]